ncbi:hypothetical protein PR202_ga02148 [Eleusine coracana subsp. coracana]|uniref:Homeobox-leucine zipper protein n=1 Tax=Eleusine coracana subsp. coracana TaxID=191504 RepID=A0AAV5BK52_ELECO|nr:hypothetical protein QOZ80_2BG0194870 [Eleusine coracana subsp. coracana]GJM86302.1 hypothetical protein PR202_ga02148 [Eleusine coracana subsp. coracana]
MEERECHRFMVPPPHQQYEEQLLHQLMMVGGGGDHHDPGAAGTKGERKRRFTEEQVRSLETTFHARRAKLEPREKAELARELGLQPRQVAIWFQNKRARWRSKQLEHDYADLQARYDALRGRVEVLKQEKIALANQLDELKGRLNERQDQSASSCDINGGGTATASEVDDKRNNSNNNSVSSQDDTAAMAPMTASEDSTTAAAAAGYYDDDVAYYGGGLTDPFCNPPELWDAWPLLEWNAVA